MVRRHVAIRIRLLEEGYASNAHQTDRDGLRNLFGFTFTWHYLLVATLIVVPSAVKARAAQKGQAILSNALDVFIGVGVTFSIMLLSALKKRRSSGLLWFFEAGCVKHLRKCFGIIVLLAFRSRSFIFRAVARMFFASAMDADSTSWSGAQRQSPDLEVLQRRFQMRPVKSFRWPKQQHSISRDDEDIVSTRSSFYTAEECPAETGEGDQAAPGLQHDSFSSGLSSSNETSKPSKSGRTVLPPLFSAFAGPYSETEHYSLPSRMSPMGDEDFATSFPFAYPSKYEDRPMASHPPRLHHHVGLPENQMSLRSHLPPIIVPDRTPSEHSDSHQVSPYTRTQRDSFKPSPQESPLVEYPNVKKRKHADAAQLRVLNEVYARTAFPTTEERLELANKLNMSTRSVQIWFQNKRQSARQGRLSASTSALPRTLRHPYAGASSTASVPAPIPTTGRFGSEITIGPTSPAPAYNPSAGGTPKVDTPSSATHPAVDKKRKRTNVIQRKVLNEVYCRTAFPTTEERMELAKKLDMSARSVQIWFQEKRASSRQKRHSANPSPQ